MVFSELNPTSYVSNGLVAGPYVGASYSSFLASSAGFTTTMGINTITTLLLPAGRWLVFGQVTFSQGAGAETENPGDFHITGGSLGSASGVLNWESVSGSTDGMGTCVGLFTTISPTLTLTLSVYDGQSGGGSAFILGETSVESYPDCTGIIAVGLSS
jgi:hypothetical protein